MKTKRVWHVLVKVMSSKRYLIGVTLLALLFMTPVLTCAAETTEPITLVWASHWPPQMFPQQHLDKWFKKLEDLSGGQLKIKRYPGATLSAINTALQDLRAGSTDFQSVSVHIFTAEFPITHTMQYFWYDYPNTVLATQVFWETYNHFPEIQGEFKKQGVMPLCTIVPGAMQLHSRKAVGKVDDVKNLQVGIGGAYLIPVFKDFGAMPSSISYLEFYQALQKGIIDATTFNNEHLKVGKLAEVTKYTTSLGGSYDACGGIFSVREETWKKLPPNIQKIFNESLMDLRMSYGKGVEAANEEGKKFALEKGHQFLEWSPDDMKKWYAVCEKVARSEAAKIDKEGYPLTKIFEYTRTVKAELESKEKK
jgi:TRAP-type transport system periplasmic protein